MRGRTGGRGSEEFRRRFIRKEDAERWLVEMMRTKQLGGVVLVSKLTLDEYRTEWWQRAERELAPATALNYKGVLKRGHVPSSGV